MEKSLEEAYALAEAARLRQVVDRLRCLAAATAELEAAVRGGPAVTSATSDVLRNKKVTLSGLPVSERG